MVHDRVALYTDSQEGTITLYYRNQKSDDYKKVERRMRKIIYRDALPTQPDTHL